MWFHLLHHEEGLFQEGETRRHRANSCLSCLRVTLTWPQSCGRHLCGHEPSQVLDLGFGSCWLHWGVDGLKGGRHDLRQVHHADEDLWVPRKRSLSLLIDLINVGSMPRPLGKRQWLWQTWAYSHGAQTPGAMSNDAVWCVMREGERAIRHIRRPGTALAPRGTGTWAEDWVEDKNPAGQGWSLAVGGGCITGTGAAYGRRQRGSRASTLPKEWKEVQ